MQSTDLISCFSAPSPDAIPLEVILQESYSDWFGQQDERTQNWLSSMNFRGEAKQSLAIPDANGRMVKAIVVAEHADDFWALASASKHLPPKLYQLINAESERGFLAWALAQYEMPRYREPVRARNQIVLPKAFHKKLDALTRSIYFVRDLINMPTEDMGPVHLAFLTESLANQFNAEFSQIVGEDLLKENFPAIHAVGRAAPRAPRLLELRWGLQYSKKLTLVGKGVCFDSGGLDLKPAAQMRLMKKDMGGAAHVLGLAKMIMALQLPIHLQVLIPAVENSVSSHSYRPGDVIKMRSGLTVEVDNTDAEGRLVLADALSYAAEFQPELLVDMATLTGAARVALGTEIGVLFSNRPQVAQEVLAYATKEQDPLWQLPLYQPYRDLFRSQIANTANCGDSPFAGAITAALFLESFVNPKQSWLHFDIMAWNLAERPGRPVGGEAMGLRALLAYFENWVK